MQFRTHHRKVGKTLSVMRVLNFLVMLLVLQLQAQRFIYVYILARPNEGGHQPDVILMT